MTAIQHMPIAMIARRIRPFSFAEIFTAGLKTIRIHILSQQRYFFITFVCQVTHLIQNTFHITAALTPTGIRHNTIMTEIIATTHNGYKPGEMCIRDRFYPADKTLQGFLYQLAGDMFRRIGSIYLLLQVE